MSKRRRTSSVQSRGQDDDGDQEPASHEPHRKRKKLDPAEICHQLYDTIRNHKKDDGTLLCDAFIRVPKRRQEPGYYEVVTNPIDLLKVQQKLKTDEYEDVDDLTTDIQLMVNNAKAFYKRMSQEYRDACDLWELFNSTKASLMDAESKHTDDSDRKGKIILKGRRSAADSKKSEVDDDDNSSTHDDDINVYEELFTTVMTATDADNRPLHTVFQLLPSKKRYPEYYEVIENPIDLKMIATKIQQNKYQTLNDLEKDLLLMTRNACQFNEPGSQIYKDAKALRKIISSRKTEIEHGKLVGAKGSERTRSKRLRGSQSLSAITAALRDEEEESEDEGLIEEDTAEDTDNPRWQLYETIKNNTNNQGHLLSEPFWKLPSRRYYPDYYKEIKNPISLSQIRKKLQRGEYGTVSEVAGDMNIMFENAKKYNRADSRLYKDAAKLQKIMQAKVQELLEFDQDSESEDDSDDRSARRKSTRKSASTTPKPTKLREDMPLKKRLHALFKCLIDYVHEDGRQPVLMFMEKPSKKLYPDYFQVIAEPIDMLTIEANIKNEKYNSEEEIIADFKLMFNNCRQYNEEGSMIYEDANKLEEVLMEKVKELGALQESVKKTPRVTKPRKVSNATALSQKLRMFYDAIRDYKDPKNRQLSLIFQKLPSKTEYPDYYEVIKNPMDLEKIAQKLKTNQYESIEAMSSDFVLMFDNACKYNEPDSQIYKDALMLQRVALQTKSQLREDEDAVPDVAAAVQELLTSLFISVYNHQDEEGRCFSDSMAELPEHDEVDGTKVRALSLDLVKRRLDKGLYRRLDVFQEDVFACMERARRLSRTDSQVFEDSIELQSYFIRQRDELCRGGDLLHSPALNYSLLHLAADVETVRQQKLQQEQPEDETETRSSEDSMRVKDSETHTDTGGNATQGDSLSFNQQIYHVGDFVYAEPKERGMEPSIIHVERLWTNQEGCQMMYGNVFFRPNETYHVTTRKFLEKEVFKSDIHFATPLSQILGRCCVLSVKDYFRFRPDGFLDKDVYVCESRYSTRARAFKKIKVWPFTVPPHVTLVQRDEVLEAKRSMSVFRERVEKHKEEIAELEEREKLVEKEKPNIEVFNPQGHEGHTYYEQFNTPAALLRTGDCVYVRSDNGKQLIQQIDSMWMNKQGACFFRGPFMVSPVDIPQTPQKLFYKQEVFLSNVEETNPVEFVVGRCAVLEHAEYISCRPTEIPEQDVYVCESVYDESRRQIKKLPREGLKKYAHSNAVIEDEIYFFRRLINPPKIGSESAQNTEGIKFETDQSPLLPKIAGDPEVMTEDSLDGGPPSVGSGDTTTPSATPVAKKKSQGKKLVTGYILYSGDVRRAVQANHPDSSFGEISRIVGNEWRNLPAQEKQVWEERAAKVNEETAAKLESENCPSPTPAGTGNSGNAGPDTIYECLWDNCDWQFEDQTDCIDHCVNESSGHVQAHFASAPQDTEYQCQWRGCVRLRKGMPPFPSVLRLARHVKEIHLLKGNGRAVPLQERSKNFVPSRRPVMTPSRPPAPVTPQAPLHGILVNQSQTAHQNYSRETPSPHTQPSVGGQSVSSVGTIQKPVEPIFVPVPPRPQRLLHSEAYIKYIEGLNVDNKYISNWNKQLDATPENTSVQDPNRLPVHWLGNGVGNHGNVINALWTLRDFMLRDALGISKVI
ncbi:protein polybromo-1 isoform X3 [Schistocerca gregaria]|uniref:protein polybromo-1 isoform X3 n=1 Tax=Schistocerca gregaria TaxID=7010 RepID=UPI00211E7547|nr:protein polybromo-1 isoform X3 [Schistocerca gregaria]XP_049837848.1 protein polybromo-1 isoform X3 [Schistocerca gregaria]